MVRGLQPGDPPTIGPYRLVGQLGSGGMGRVFLGVSAGGRPVAVKVIRADLAADPEFRMRFGREVASDPRVAKLSTDQRAELKKVLKDALDGRRLATELTGALAASGDKERLAAAVAAMHDPVYLKVTHRMVVESQNTTPQALVAYANGFQKHPPDPSRVQLIQRLDAATGSSRILADMRYDMVSKALGRMLDEADREAKLATLREQIDANAPNEFLLLTLYVSRKIDSKDLEGYVHAHENEPMGWLSRQLGYAIQRPMVDAMIRMTDKLVDLAAKRQ